MLTSEPDRNNTTRYKPLASFITSLASSLLTLVKSREGFISDIYVITMTSLYPTISLRASIIST